MLKRLSFFIAAISFILFPSCETEDFSVNGAYTITPVVIGLLDYNDDVHIVKITKAYLGDGDNLVYAQNPDSNYFNNVYAIVKEIDPTTGDYTGREWPLHDSTVTDKSTEGAFYAPEQKVYVFHCSTLDELMEYEIQGAVEDSTYFFNAKTSMMKNFKVSSQLTLPTYKINFAAATVMGDGDYKSWSFTVTEAENAARYNFKYTMRWRETYADLSTKDFSATRNDGDVIQEKPSAPTAQIQNFSGVDFYNWVVDVVPSDPDVIRRELLGIDLRISVAHYEMDQFMQVGAPVTGIVQNKPEYTNVNGGLGIFSSRIVYELNNYRLDKNSIKELCKGNKTIQLLFCSTYPEDVAESWACP